MTTAPLTWAYRPSTRSPRSPAHFFHGPISLCRQIPLTRCTPVAPSIRHPMCRLCREILFSSHRGADARAALRVVDSAAQTG